DPRRAASYRPAGSEVLRALLFSFPSARSRVARIRRSREIAHGIVETDRNQVLLIEIPGEFKYAGQQYDQHRRQDGGFDQRRSSLVPAEGLSLSQETVAQRSCGCCHRYS